MTKTITDNNDDNNNDDNDNDNNNHNQYKWLITVRNFKTFSHVNKICGAARLPVVGEVGDLRRHHYDYYYYHYCYVYYH